MRKKRYFIFLLSIIMVFSTMNFSFANSDAPKQPEKPKVESYKDNDKIENYNKEVKDYNKEVDKYNAGVDKEYSAAKADVDQKNAEGQAKQEASQKAHDEAVAANEAEQERVDSENKKIDETNAANASSVSSHNASEDAKVEQNKKDRENAENENASRREAYEKDLAAAEKEYEDAVAAEKERVEKAKEENVLIRQHNEEEEQKVAEVEAGNKAEKERIDAENAEIQAKYDADKAQYDEDYAAYTSAENQTDIKNENIILNAGYTSIGEYNMLPLKSGPVYDEETGTYIDNSEEFEKLLEKAVYRKEVRQENNALKEKEYASTVDVKEAEEKSGETYTLYLTHILSNGQEYTETITFDANDTVTIKSLAYADNSKPLYEDENYGAFYNYQGDKYLSYYWYQTYGQFEYPPLKEKTDYQESQDKGNSYTFSYKNGKKNDGDENKIYVTYYYNSRITCNIPLSEPTAPTLDLIEFEPTVYTPDFWEELDEEEHLIEKRTVTEPDYMEVPEIYNPIYETYTPLPYISPVFVDVPDIEEWINLPDPVKKEYLKHLSFMDLLSRPVIPTNNNPTIVNTINPTPTEPEIKYGLGDNTEIKNIKTPLTTTVEVGYWALINLIATLLTILLAIILLIMTIINNRKEDEETEVKNKIWLRFIGCIIAIISGFIFLITEDISLPMQLIDKWTLLMVVIFVIEIIIAIFSRHKEEEKE